MKKGLSLILVSLTIAALTVLPACQANPIPSGAGNKSIVVTYPLLGSLVRELAGDSANVTVLMPNGTDPHGWEPSAKDIEAVNKADLVVQNGLDLESGIQKTISEASGRGVKIFTASDYISIRQLGENGGAHMDDHRSEAETEDEHEAGHENEAQTGHGDGHHHAAGAGDPHLWTDPVSMKNVVTALSNVLKTDLGINSDSRLSDLQQRLDSLDKDISGMVSAIPAADRKLVTGHESLGYFAGRYGFQLIGAIIPSTTSQAAVSAYDMAALKKLIHENQVRAIFTEVGTSPAVARAIGDETGVRVMELNTHMLPEDGSYFTFIRNMAEVIAEGLK